MRPSALLPERRVWLPAGLAAVLLFVAYKPFGLSPLAFVALVPFLRELEAARARGWTGWTAARLGYWFGVVVNGVVLYWLVIALWHFTPLSLAGYLAAVLIVLAPQWALAAWLVARIRRTTTLPLVLVFPLVWTAVEWIGGHLGDVRFPWLGLGTALGGVPLLAQWADLAGARGLTCWAAWVNVALYEAAMAVASRRTRRAAGYAAAVLATIVAAAGYGAWREHTLVMRPVATVAVIQPNFGYDEKAASRGTDTLLTRMLDLTRRAGALPGVRLIVWSEAVLDEFFDRRPDVEQAIGTLARTLKTPILAGALDEQYGADGSWQYYNAAFLFDTTGSDRAQPSYRKTYLVPLVERVPFVNPRWFGRLQYFGGFGRGDRFPVYHIAAGRFGVLICYESAFEDLARGYRRRGADFLVNITNDSWYGTTAAPAQHASHLVMRAIETRMGIARAAQTGISEFVDPLGHEHDRTGLDTLAVEAQPVLTTDGLTVYVRLGDWVAALALAGTAAMLVAAQWRRHTQPGVA